MSVNTGFIFGGTAGARRSTVVRIRPKGTERNISGIFVIATVGTAQRTMEKLVFAVFLPRPPQQLWTPIATVRWSKWAKETLCS